MYIFMKLWVCENVYLKVVGSQPRLSPGMKCNLKMIKSFEYKYLSVLTIYIEVK